ncbi:MAG: aminoacyl-tRNA hydrolase, partial [bacterium]
GGHNGLKSISQSLGTESYSRLKIGVGRPSKGIELSDWVLSGMAQEDEESVLALLPTLAEAVQVWMTEGVQGAMNQFNR